MVGYIDFWRQDRAFGFVKTPGSEQKYFLHITSVVSGRATAGAHVRFESGRSSKGLVALNVHVISAEEAAAAVPAVAGFVASGEGEVGVQ